MQESETRRLRLAVEEAVTNVILYAYPGRTGQPISIRFEAEAQRVKVVICDSGIPFDPTRLVPPDLKLPLESRPIGGLGTFLLKELMSEVQYRREGDRNILTLIKTIN
jgi:anti-sigma regulatory factor (Ser/Thr protein kinase)